MKCPHCGTEKQLHFVQTINGIQRQEQTFDSMASLRNFFKRKGAIPDIMPLQELIMTLQIKYK